LMDQAIEETDACFVGKVFNSSCIAMT